MEKETWKSVVGYEGYYEISSVGNVRSVPRTVMSGGFERKRKGKNLKPDTNKYGYLVIDLSKYGNKKKRTIHSLVVDAFLNEVGEVVNHKDGNKKNNHYSNLERISAIENTAHAKANGLIPKGSNNHRAKIDERTALTIKCLLKKGIINQSDIARLMSTTRAIVRNIKTGATWGHVGTASDYPTLTTTP